MPSNPTQHMLSVLILLAGVIKGTQLIAFALIAGLYIVSRT